MEEIGFRYYKNSLNSSFAHSMDIYVDRDKVEGLKKFLQRQQLPYLMGRITCWPDYSKGSCVVVHFNFRTSQEDKDEIETLCRDFVSKGRSDLVPRHFRKLTIFIPGDAKLQQASWHS